MLIVRDTRESGPMLESALAAGVAAAGGDALLGGVLPTPAASILVKRHGLDLGAVVSASHNPLLRQRDQVLLAAGRQARRRGRGRDRAPDREPRGREGGRAGARAAGGARGLPAGADPRLPARPAAEPR